MQDLEILVRQSGVIGAEGKRVPGARDVFLYTFEIEDQGKAFSVTFDELSVPEPAKPLVEFLLARSKSLMP